MTQHEVDVLICTWNRAALLDKTLSSLARMNTPSGIRCEVTAVGSNSGGETRVVVERAAARFPVPVRYVFEREQGKSIAMNTGLRVSRRPIAAFVDDDVRVSENWLTSDAFSAHPMIGYVGGAVDPIREAPCPTWFDRSGKSLWVRLAILDYGDEAFVFEDRHKVPLGANFAVRRLLVEQIGGFDPALGRNGQHVLLGQELPEFFAPPREAGARGRYVPQMRLRRR